MNARTLKNYCDFLDYVKSKHIDSFFYIEDIDEKLLKKQINAWRDFFDNLKYYIDNTALCDIVASYIVNSLRDYKDKYEKRERDFYGDI